MSGSPPALTEALRRYVLTSIPSVPYLEALLLLHAEPAREWSAAALAARLYVPEARAQGLLQELQQSQLAATGPQGCRFAPATPALAALADELAAAYARDLLGITQLIHARTERRAIQFADAFRMRKEE